MFRIETRSERNGSWVALGGNYPTRQGAEEAIDRFLLATLYRPVPYGQLAQKREYRIVRV